MTTLVTVMSLLLLFIDGLGIGKREGNPLCAKGVDVLNFGPDFENNYSYKGAVAQALDATVGVSGLPQSATGQTAIFTGVNTPRLIGRHLSGWPNARLREALSQTSIFINLRSSGHSAAFANAFTPAYFLRPVGRMSASSLHMLLAGMQPRWIWQIPDGAAVFQDFTNRLLIEGGFRLPEHTPEQAGRNLASFLGEYDFTLYEYFLTDAAAHGRIRMTTAEVIGLLDRMIATLLDCSDLGKHCIALCSDHGNIEDSSVRSHTLNPVPFVAWGADAGKLVEGIVDITGIASAVNRFFQR